MATVMVPVLARCRLPIASPPVGYTLNRPGSVGKPLGIHLRILDGAGDAVPDGEVGEVSLLHNPAFNDQLFDGYEAAGPSEPVVEAGVRCVRIREIAGIVGARRRVRCLKPVWLDGEREV